MTTKLNRLWMEAKLNETFLREMETAERANGARWEEPSMLWSEMQKLAFSAMYWGWKVGKKLN